MSSLPTFAAEVLLLTSAARGFPFLSPCSLGFDLQPWGLPPGGSSQRVASWGRSRGVGWSHWRLWSRRWQRWQQQFIDLVGWTACPGTLLASLVGASRELFGRCSSSTCCGRELVPLSALGSVGASSGIGEMSRCHESPTRSTRFPVACGHGQTIGTRGWRGNLRGSGGGRF